MSVSIVILARDKEASGTLERCLRSLYERETPIASEVIVYEGGHPAAVVRAIVERLGFPGLRFEEAPRSIPRTDDGGIGDFAAFRNAAFGLAKNEWVGYLDADDVWPAPKATGSRAPDGTPVLSFSEALGKLSPSVDEVWMPYHYAIDGKGVVIEKFDTPRFVRWRRGFYWRNRTGGCHEMLVKLAGAPAGGRVFTGDAAYIEHYPTTPAADRMARNAKLMEAARKGGLLDWGLLHFLAREEEVRGRFADALKHDQQALLVAKAEHEQMISYAAICRLHAICGDLQEGFRVAACAHARFPTSRSVLACMVEIAAAAHMPIFEFWYAKLLAAPAEQQHLDAKNAYATDLWPHLAVGREFMRLGRPGEALKAANRCLAKFSYDAAAQALAREASEAKERADARRSVFTLHQYVRKTLGVQHANQLVLALDGDLYDAACCLLEMPDHTTGTWLQTPLERRPPAQSCAKDQDIWNSAEPRDRILHIYAPVSLVPWSPRQVCEEGGTAEEEALVQAAEALARGRRVVVYAKLSEKAHVRNGVLWRPLEQFRPGDKRAVLIGYQDPSVLLRADVVSDARIAWVQNASGNNEHHLAWRNGGDKRINAFVCGSNWHKDLLVQKLGVDPGRLFVVPATAAESDKPGAGPRRRASGCYLGNPDMGLVDLLSSWPKIREKCSDATLDVFCRLKTCDAAAHDFPIMGAMKAILVALAAQPGVTLHETLGEEASSRLLQTSMALLYPVNQDDAVARNVRRALACGTKVVAYSRGAVDEVLGHPGVARDDAEAFVAAAVAALGEESRPVAANSERPRDAILRSWSSVLSAVEAPRESEVNA